MAIRPPYSTVQYTHYCKTCKSFFVFDPPKPEKPKRERMSLEEVFTEGVMPTCPTCNAHDAVTRLIRHRPPYASPIVVLKGSGQGTGLAALALKGKVTVPKSWPCVDERERKCTHFCATCQKPFREPSRVVPPDPVQVRIWFAFHRFEALFAVPLRDSGCCGCTHRCTQHRWMLCLRLLPHLTRGWLRGETRGPATFPAPTSSMLTRRLSSETSPGHRGYHRHCRQGLCGTILPWQHQPY